MIADDAASVTVERRLSYMHLRATLGLSVVMLAFLTASNEAGRRQSPDESGVLWHVGTGG
jgi:hypothetical protein